MAAESAFVAVPLGHDAPSSRPPSQTKGYRELLVLVAITAVLLLCQIHQNVFFVDTKQDSSTVTTQQVIKWDSVTVDYSAPSDEVDEDDFFSQDSDFHLSVDREDADSKDLNQEHVEALSNSENLSNKVVILTDDTFDAVTQDNENVFVDMYTPWCTWCQQLSPTWTEFAAEANTLQLPVVVAKLDCVKHVEACRSQKVMAFPTLRWYHNGESVAPDYKMDRTVQALVGFAKRKLEMPESDNYVNDSQETSQQVPVLGADGSEEESEVVPIGDHADSYKYDPSEEQDDLPALRQSLSNDESLEYPKNAFISPPNMPNLLASRVDDYHASEEEEEDRGLFAPTLHQQSPSEDYPREEAHSQDDRAKDSVQGQPCKHPVTDEAVFDSTDSVILTDDTFHQCIKDHELVFIDFFAPWCVWSQRLAPTWNEFATSLKDSPEVQIAQVNCVTHRDLCVEQGIVAFPTLRLYRQGSRVISDYRMERTVSAFTLYINKYMTDTKTTFQDSTTVEDIPYDSIEDSNSEDVSLDDYEREDSERLSAPKAMQRIKTAVDKKESTDVELEDYVEEKDFGVQLPRWMATVW